MKTIVELHQEDIEKMIINHLHDLHMDTKCIRWILHEAQNQGDQDTLVALVEVDHANIANTTKPS